MAQSRWFPLVIAAFLAGFAVVLGLVWGTDQIDQWRLASRYTARVGFPVFITVYAASSLLALWPGTITRTIARYRRQWGLGFALTHGIHLIALTGYNMLQGHTPDLTTLIGGGGAYAILYAMALTSNDRSMRAIGRYWKWLHRTGIHWLWFIFAFSYAGRVAKLEDPGIAPYFLAIALAALGLRVLVWTKRRQRHAPA